MNTLTLTVTETSTGAIVVIEAPGQRPDACEVTAQRSTVITLGDVEITISRRLPETEEREPSGRGYIDPAIDAQLAAL